MDDILSVTSHSLLLLPPSMSLLPLSNDLLSTSAIDDDDDDVIDDDDNDDDDIAARLSPNPLGLVEGGRVSESRESGLERFIIVGMDREKE